jgi:hypothetical protein
MSATETRGMALTTGASARIGARSRSNQRDLFGNLRKLPIDTTALNQPVRIATVFRSKERQTMKSKEPTPSFETPLCCANFRSGPQVHHEDNDGASFLRGHLARRSQRDAGRRQFDDQCCVSAGLRHSIGSGRRHGKRDKGFKTTRMIGSSSSSMCRIMEHKSENEDLPKSPIDLAGTALAATTQPVRSGTSCAKATTAALHSRLRAP